MKETIWNGFRLAGLAPLLLGLCLLVCPGSLFALGQFRYVETRESPGSFALVQPGAITTLYVDSNDHPGVVRAVGDLEADFARVTGRTAAITNQESGLGVRPILAGTLGKSRLIDKLLRDGKIDAAAIAGKWESFFVQVVDNPLPGVARALVIVGSDKRGTIYGIYDLSEQIGVSPWYWWADVPVPHHDALFVKPGRFVQGEPGVRYRGIFLNDEAPALSGWAKEKFGGFNHNFYVKVFELLLRLKANYLWPAMWDSAFNEDDPLNPKLADEYGIVMGTSHHEPMLRAQQEWKRHGQGPWDYKTNAAVLRAFWDDGIRRNRNYESIITIGMRGDGDLPMDPSGSIASNVGLLEKIVAGQRAILAQRINPDLSQVPQLWALYKEVQGYYEAGMRVPDDVTLLWCDDNWGNLRRLPTPEERKRGGGAGIYYHFDYVGGPRSYKWLNTVPITKVWEQMNLAYQYGARRIWIVNVGDLKPMEFPTEFFLSMAWDPQRWSKGQISEFTRLWAEREFGPAEAAGIADIVSKYTKYNGRRKPELLEPDTFSLENYHEADTVLAEWKSIAGRAEQIDRRLPAEAKAAFFELVLYPVKACAQVNELYITVAKNRLYASQGLAIANDFAARARALFQADADLSAAYNHDLAHGKWDHMMDQTHIGYTSWRDPPVNVMPAVIEVPHPSKLRPPPAVKTPPAVKKGEQPRPPERGFAGFVEADGYVSIEAEHYTKKTDAATARWEKIDDYGRTLSSMTVFPVTAASANPPENSPSLEYRMYLFDSGSVTVNAILAPTLNFVPGRGLRFALSWDGKSPQILDALAQNSQKDWERSVEDSVRIVKFTSTLAQTGYHVLTVWMVDPGVVLQKLVIDLGGVQPSYLGPPESQFDN